MRQLRTRLDRLSYSDSNLVREGWNLALQLSHDRLDCGMALGLEDDPSVHLKGGNSMPSREVQQRSKHEQSDPLPSQE